MRLFCLILTAILIPISISAATLDPPWKPVLKKPGYEFWYNPTSVKHFGGIIDVEVWEVRPDSAANKKIRYDVSNGQVAVATGKGYKYGKLVSDLDFTKVGYFYSKPVKEYKLLFKKLKKDH